MYIYTVKFFQQLCLAIVDCSLLPHVRLRVYVFVCLCLSIARARSCHQYTHTRSTHALSVSFILAYKKSKQF